MTIFAQLLRRWTSTALNAAIADSERRQESDSLPSSEPTVRIGNAPVNARIAEFACEANRLNHRMMPTFQRKAKGLTETINTFDAQIIPVAREAQRAEENWSRHADRATHVPFASSTTLTVVVGAIVVGEAIMGGKSLASLHLGDLDKWLLAVGMVAATTYGVKASAWGARGLADDRHDGFPVNLGNLFGLICGVSLASMMISAQHYARLAFILEAQAIGEAAMSGAAAASLTLAQAALYGSLGVVMYFREGPLRSERARKNYQAARAKLNKLHTKRAKVSAALNELVHSLHSTWQTRVALAQSITAEYVQEMANYGKPLQHIPDLQTIGCDPVPSFTWTPADAGACEQQYTLEVGPLSATAMASLNQHGDFLLHRRAFLEPSHLLARQPHLPPQDAANTSPIAGQIGPKGHAA